MNWFAVFMRGIMTGGVGHLRGKGEKMWWRAQKEGDLTEGLAKCEFPANEDACGLFCMFEE